MDRICGRSRQLCRGSAYAGRYSPQSEATVKQPTLLLVDAYDASRHALADLLREYGYAVFEGRNAVEGLHLAREQLPDAIILDLWPFFSASLRMVERLRTSGVTARIPVVVLTSSLTPAYRQRALNSGCAGYLEKPCRSEALHEELRRILDEPEISFTAVPQAPLAGRCG